MLGLFSKFRNLISILPKSRIIFILGGLILLLAIPLTVFVAQQQQQTKQHASFTNPASNFSSLTKSYQQLIAEKAIDPAREILEVSLSYDESKDPQISVSETRILNGYVPYQFDDLSPNAYTLQELDNYSRVLYKIRFEIPNDVHVDPNPDGTITVPVHTELKQVDFIQTIPYFSAANSITISDPKGKIIASKSLKDIPKIDNKPNFHSIRRDKYLEISPLPNPNILNLEFKLFFSKSFAKDLEEGDGFIDIVFIDDRYNGDFDRFHKDVDNIISGFLQLEPYKSRASQLRFNYIDSEVSLECRHTLFSLLICDRSQIARSINRNAVPHDYIIVINNDSNIEPRGVSWGDYIILNPNKPESFQWLLGYTLGHEMGHSIGKLYDEYLGIDLAGKIVEKIVSGRKKNCYPGTILNPEWKNLVGKEDYFKGCLEQDWFRSSEYSIMTRPEPNGKIPYFNAVSQKAINEAIDKIAGPYTEDKTPPQVKFESLDSEDQTLKIKALATDNKGVAYVQFWVDDVFLKTAYTTPYEFFWDTSSLKDNKKHILYLKAYDVSGNVGQAERTINEAIKITLGGDLKKGMTVSKQTRADINVPEENKETIVKIDLFVDDKLVKTVQHDSLKELYKNKSAQYGFWLDPKGYSMGTHKFYAKVYSGTMATTSDTIVFDIAKDNFEKDDAYKDRDFPSDVTPTPASALNSTLYNQCIEICGQSNSDCIQKCDNLYKQPSPTSAVVQSPFSAPTPTSAPAAVSPTVPTNIPTTTISTIPTSLNLHSLGDADRDGKISRNDYALWFNETAGIFATKTADFDGNGIVNTDDYNIWRDSMNNPNLPH